MNFQIVFFEDVEGLVEIAASAGGSATLTVTRQTSAYEGSSTSPTEVPLPVSNWANGVMLAVPGATLQAFAVLGATAIILTATLIVGPGAPTALTYRLMVDAETS